MDGNVAIELAIGLSFMFFLLSVIASGLGEWISRMLTLRAKTLRDGIRSLIEGDPDGELTRLLYERPAIRSLSKAPPLGRAADGGAGWLSPANWRYAWLNPLKWRVAWLKPENWRPFLSTRLPLFIRRNVLGREPGPSAIPSRRFADSFTDILLADHPETRTAEAMGVITADLKDPEKLGMLPEPARERLVAITRSVEREVDDAAQRFAEFRSRLEGWFDDSMDRVTGWYKRKLQIVLFGIGIFLAVSININAFTVASALWSNDAQRETIVLAASDTSEAMTVDAADELLARIPLPIGWSSDLSDPRMPDSNWGWLAHVFGWLVTAAAISFGSPFWFDLMNKFVDLRGGGKDSTKVTGGGTTAGAGGAR